MINNEDSLKNIQINDSIFNKTDFFVKFRCRYKQYNEYFKPINIKAKGINIQSFFITKILTKKAVDVEL